MHTSPGGCACGSDACLCDPSFELEIDQGTASVKIDGRVVVSLYRPEDPSPTAASREVIWTTAPAPVGLPRPEPDRPSPPTPGPTP